MALYSVDMAKVIAEIKKSNAKRVMLQLPDGLKPCAKEFTERIEGETGAVVLVWAGSCYGACDLPQGINKLGVDLLFHFGHTAWRV